MRDLRLTRPRAALAGFFFVLAGAMAFTLPAAAARPATGSHTGTTNHISVDVTCETVKITSTKTINTLWVVYKNWKIKSYGNLSTFTYTVPNNPAAPVIFVVVKSGSAYYTKSVPAPTGCSFYDPCDGDDEHDGDCHHHDEDDCPGRNTFSYGSSSPGGSSVNTKPVNGSLISKVTSEDTRVARGAIAALLTATALVMLVGRRTFRRHA